MPYPFCRYCRCTVLYFLNLELLLPRQKLIYLTQFFAHVGNCIQGQFLGRHKFALSLLPHNSHPKIGKQNLFPLYCGIPGIRVGRPKLNHCFRLLPFVRTVHLRCARILKLFLFFLVFIQYRVRTGTKTLTITWYIIPSANWIMSETSFSHIYMYSYSTLQTLRLLIQYSTFFFTYPVGDITQASNFLKIRRCFC